VVLQSWFGEWSHPEETPLTHIQSLAVLPLENLSHDPEQEYSPTG